MIRTRRRPLAATLWLCAFLPIGCAPSGGSPSDSEVNASALPGLIEGLKSPDSAVRVSSAIAIGRIGPTAEAAVPSLIATLKDRDVSVRAAAAFSLGQIGSNAKTAVPELESLSKQTGPLRDVAQKALKEIKG